jgi:hypothetical protein
MQCYITYIQLGEPAIGHVLCVLVVRRCRQAERQNTPQVNSMYIRHVRMRTKQTVLDLQNYWVFGLCPSSGILETRSTVFRKLDLFPSLGEGEKTPTQFGPLERANLNHWTSGLSRCLLSHLHLRTENDSVSETLCSLEYQTMEKRLKKPVILCVIHPRQNPLESTCIRPVVVVFFFIIIGGVGLTREWSDPTCRNLPWFFFSLQEYTQQNPLSKF